MKTALILIALLLPGLIPAGMAQDTLKLNLRQAEQMFVQHNHQLMAQHYQIEQAKAEIITARLFDNPELSYENQLYNKNTRKWLQTNSTTGQYQATLSQMIRLAGKRNKNIQLAGAGVKMAAHQYFDLMRSLRFSLGSAFYKAYYQQQSAKVYEEQIRSLKMLLGANEQQFKAGNVAMKDIIRIKSLLYSLQVEYTGLINNIADLQTEIKLMTNVRADANLQLELTAAEEQDYHPEQRPYIALLDSARLNRADLQLAQTGISYAESSLKLQKANAIPDVELSLSYDLQGSYPEKYTGIGIKVPLPLFNRNQGEIKKAKIAIEEGKTNLKQQNLKLENEVYNAYTSALRTENLYQGIDRHFSGDFDKLIAEVVRNFKNRNISLIEFLDFYDSYKASTLQMNELKYERMNAREELNFVTGSSLFK